MKDLPTIARWTTPAAMVTFLSYELHRSVVTENPFWQIAFLVGSVASAVGIELVGILAGRTMEGYLRVGNLWRGSVSFLLLAVYTVTAVFVLRHNQTLVVVPIIAAVVYILASLSDGLEIAVVQKDKKASVQQEYLIEQRKADDELERRLKARRLEIKHEERMAEITAGAAPQDSQPFAAASQAAGPYECVCGRVFEKPQSYSAHTRSCKILRPQENGHRVGES